jgi:Mg-chelatase subunit ChlI
LGEAVTSLALQKALEALLALDVTITKTDDGSPDKFAYEWTKLLRAVGQLSNQSIANKQYRSKVQKIIEEEIKAMELEARAKATGTVAEQAEAEVMNLALEKVRQIHGLI